MHYYKTKPYGIPIGSFTVPKVAENAEANDEEDEESSALDEELIMINDEGVQEFEMDYEEHKEDNGTTIENNPNDV